MFKLIKGARFENAVLLKEGYSVDGEWLTANVSREHIRPLFDHFLEEEGDQLYSFWIEEPASITEKKVLREAMQEALDIVENVHMDVYYLEGITADVIRQILDAFGEILINDGLAYFGILCENGDELGKYKCNVLRAYSSEGNLSKVKVVMAKSGIPKNDGLVTIWDLTHPGIPAESFRYEKDRKNVPGIIKTLEGIGLRKVEERME